MTSALLKTHVKGHVLIQNGMTLKNGILVPDELTGTSVLDKYNAIHNQNMAEAIARGLSNTNFDAIGTHQIYGIGLGRGGSSVDGTGNITYLAPNVTGTGARLYDQTYFEVVDEQQAGTPAANSVTYQNSGIDTTSIVIVTATIAAGEPAGQILTDSPPDSDTESEFFFDELGLFTYGQNGAFGYSSVPTDSLLLSHIIFSPILKTANRELVITYTLTVSVS